MNALCISPNAYSMNPFCVVEYSFLSPVILARQPKPPCCERFFGLSDFSFGGGDRLGGPSFVDPPTFVGG